MEGFEKLFPIIILVIFGINMIAKWLGEQNKQAQKGAHERKRYPGLSEGEGGRPTVVTRAPSPQEKRLDVQRPTPGVARGTAVAEREPTRAARAPTAGDRLRKMDQEFEDWFREEAEEKGQVIWEAREDDIEEFLAAQRKPIPVPPTVQAPPARLPGLPEIKPTVEPPRVKVTPPGEMVGRPIAAARRIPARAPERKKRARLEMPAGVFEDMGDVRRGIIMSEILGPPVSMR